MANIFRISYIIFYGFILATVLCNNWFIIITWGKSSFFRKKYSILHFRIFVQKISELFWLI